MLYHYLNDRLGTPEILTDAAGTVVWEAWYEPFGQAHIHPSSNVVNNHRFPGQYYDEETGLHYNYHRYYDPRAGRYITPDPIGQAGGINLYNYADNNSINSTDFFGLAGLGIDFGGAFATGLGGQVKPNAPIIEGGSAGTGFYFGAKKSGYAEIGAFTYTGLMTDSGKTPGATIGAGANITIYFTDAESFFQGRLKHTAYVIGPFSLTFSQDPCTDELIGVTGSLLGRGIGWLIHSQGKTSGFQAILQ